MEFIQVCHIDDIIAGTGVCALVNQRQVALFRPTEGHEVYAISNTDPFARANVLSRGLICEHDNQLWVASPLKKQRFNLQTGQCLEDERFSVASFQVRVDDGKVSVATQ
ncbi:nitrite reductase small subunit NirD [Thaumasiovibrio subtropicus]|uniref:nitrite reductase small subunit NirD n=1 Tax=Thaumasiovibrio subtropicus TaxID=1891207 RepID=UPI000B35810D|nr:nitrite reductase small subunit NirD [Thaumasiovibrio subtropicus]